MHKNHISSSPVVVFKDRFDCFHARSGPSYTLAPRHAMVQPIARGFSLLTLPLLVGKGAYLYLNSKEEE